jgi:hypothetical protein
MGSTLMSLSLTGLAPLVRHLGMTRCVHPGRRRLAVSGFECVGLEVWGIGPSCSHVDEGWVKMDSVIIEQTFVSVCTTIWGDLGLIYGDGIGGDVVLRLGRMSWSFEMPIGV